MPSTPYNRAGPGQPIPSYDDWTLQHRGTMAPWGVYERNGETASGFAWPAMVTSPLEAANRFFSPGGGFENLPNPQSEADLLEIMLSGYGGNALSGTVKGAAATNALADMGRALSDTGRPNPLGSAIGSALDMSPEARLARAREQGFDTDRVLYHGTVGDFPAFDKGKFGSSTNASGASQAAWLVDDPMTASGYADYAAGKPVRDLLAKADTYERLAQKSGGNGGAWWDKQDDAVRQAEELEAAGYSGQSVMPIMAKGNFLEKDFGGAEYTDVAREITRLLREGKSGGYDGLKLSNLADDVALNNRPATHYAIFDPSNIRSVNAAFDPARAGENGLLLSDTGRPSLLGSAVASQADNARSPRPEPGASAPKAEAMGGSDVLAETDINKLVNEAYVKAYRADIEKNKGRYFSDWMEDPNDPITADAWGRQTGGREISDAYENATPFGNRSLLETHPAVANALSDAADAAGRELYMAPSNGGTRYGNLKTPAGNTYKVRVADHANTSSLHDAPDYNIAPGAMTPEEFLSLLPTIYSDTRPSLMGSAIASGAEQGPMRVYHGTDAPSFDKFSGHPWFTPDSRFADFYANGKEFGSDYRDGARVIAGEISPKNPYMVPRGMEIDGGYALSDLDEAAKHFGLNPERVDWPDIENAAKASGHDFMVHDINDPGGRQLQYQALAEGSVRSPYTGETLFSDTRPSLLGSALASEQGKGITAYHGSPHSFDKFDMSKIGTGEGAQAYGHGLYFAENEGVAKSYRDQLGSYDDAVRWTGDQPPTEVQQRLLSQLKGSDVRSGRAMDVPMLKRELAMMIRDAEHGMFPDEKRAAKYRAQYDELLRMEPNIELAPPGHMYQVRINANPEDFLDWDKPLRQQSEKARNALAGRFADDPVRSQDLQYEGGASTPSYILRNAADAETTKALREAGIPGIKYLDQMSRTAGDGSRNYVVFDDNLVEIMKKYGLAGALYGGTNSLYQEGGE